MAKRCHKHWFDEATATCRDCGADCCRTCQVPVRRAVYCIDCALRAGGIRRRAS